MMKRFMLFVLLMTFFLAACGSPAEEPATSPELNPTEELETESGMDEEAEPSPTSAALAQAPTEEATATAEQVTTATQAPPETKAPADTATPQPTETLEPQFNGEYEDTYYRGLETAPITMIDYSDFL